MCPELFRLKTNQAAADMKLTSLGALDLVDT